MTAQLGQQMIPLKKRGMAWSFSGRKVKIPTKKQMSLSEEYNMVNFALTEKLGKKNSEFQMVFEPTTLRDLVGCSTTELLETLW